MYQPDVTRWVCTGCGAAVDPSRLLEPSNAALLRRLADNGDSLAGRAHQALLERFHSVHGAHRCGPVLPVQVSEYHVQMERFLGVTI